MLASIYMGRLLNEKCWACSLLTPAEARKLHDAACGGDGCWVGDSCHSKRSYYRKGRQQKAQRRAAIDEVVVSS
ncbi:hypothetical protein [Chroococcidiopsis sp. SAG 2025]|uniref:hypothetical protein n=1 Tax=Chroococcidiopsis sp. SAG 2025 TaxID=171389 RepID=UPI0029372727|nr:hypothetical protein [Chroococcidiopsis sp. SAG 2025]